MLKALLVEKDGEDYRAGIASLDDSQLPPGDVTVDVAYTTLNYKDALAVTGKGPVVRSFPMVPGIDLAGTVAESAHPAFKAGDSVLLNGWGVGEKHWGGFAQKARLDGRWLIPLPGGFSARQTMAIGTAGYTAMLSVIALERHGVTPDKGEVLVTGANGGVGSFAIAILASLGYTVVASTGRASHEPYLKKLGASDIVERTALSEPGRPLMKERWAGAIDSLGSHTLANVCASTRYGGAVAACGLAQGMDFPATVAPFILRGVTLAGIDSVMRPYEDRVEAWDRLSHCLSPGLLDEVTSREISLEDVPQAASDLLDGKVRGRIIVNPNR